MLKHAVSLCNCHGLPGKGGADCTTPIPVICGDLYLFSAHVHDVRDEELLLYVPPLVHTAILGHFSIVFYFDAYSHGALL